MLTTFAPENPNNLLLVAITRMGDMLQASPTIVGLKEEYPNSKITVLIEKQFASICEGIPGIDEIYPLDLGYVVRCLAREQDGIVDAYKYIDDAFKELKGRNFDYCLNMSSSAYTALMLKMLDAKDTRGWVSDDEGHRLISNPWAMLFAAFVYHSNRDYNSINLVDIFRCSAGVRKHPHSLRYQTTAEADESIAQRLRDKGLDLSKPLICVQAGASQEKRQWSVERFAKLNELLINSLDANIVMTGAHSEGYIIDGVLKNYQHPQLIGLCGETKLDELAALLKRADVLVTGDTGPMHLAISVGTPVVALFLASALGFETGPYSPGNFVIQPQISCNPCNPNFPCSRPDCHDQISPELVAHLTKLRMETPLDSPNEFSIPTELADPKKVTVYLSTFDQDGFLDLKEINGSAPKNGLPPEYYRGARAAYRNLWKEELGAVPPRQPAAAPLNSKDLPYGAMKGLQDILGLIQEGQIAISELALLIQDEKSPAQKLGEVNYRVTQIDRNLEEIGLTYPILGALVRMFIMEKENMRGDNPLFLASEMKRLYQVLGTRTEKFHRFFCEHMTKELGTRQ